jgi:hypothetical protein
MKYKVDWSDPPFPNIRKCSNDEYDAKTFTECKQEIYEYARHIRDHWAEIVHATKALRKEDIK